MNHKVWLEYLRENDPITYSEMTSDPTGVGNGSDFSVGFILFVIILISICCYVFIG